MKKTSLTLAAALIAAAAMPASAQWAKVYTARGDRDGSRYEAVAADFAPLTLTPVKAEDYAESPSKAIVLGQPADVDIDGFGYAITYSTAANLLKMSPADRSYLLNRTFSKDHGYGVSYVRVAIGCCDFSSREYTLCDEYDPEEPLRHFGLTDDEKRYVIPVLQEILAINPDVKVIAAPWTAPAWMKVAWDNPSQPWPFFKSGSLGSKWHKTYGEYFARFVKAFADKGVVIYAVSPQNEPLNRNNNASLYMTWQQQADFVKEGLAPALKDAGLSTKIYLFDHNYNYDDVEGQDDYPVRAMQRMGSGFRGADLVAGACYHNYGGNVAELDDIHTKAPAMELLFSEASIGEWNDGRNLHTRLARDMDELVIATTLRGCRGSLVWNFMLDSEKGPHMSNGACTTCYGAVDIDRNGFDRISLNSHYYIMALASAAVQQGAQRVHTDGWWADGLSYAAFRNPDGTCAVLFANNGSTSHNVKIVADGKTYTVAVPARSAVSVLTGLESQPEEASLPEFSGTDGLEWFVCGDFQDWDIAAAPQMTPGSDGRLSLAVDRLTPGFKIVNARAWQQGEWGAPGSAALLPGRPLRLAPDAIAADLAFYYDRIDNALLTLDPATMTLTVDGTPGTPSYPTLRLAGSLNNWSLDASPVLALDTHTGVYTLENYYFPLDGSEFKLVENDTWFPQWSTSATFSEDSPTATMTRYLDKIDGWQEPVNSKTVLEGRQTVNFDICSTILAFGSLPAEPDKPEDALAVTEADTPGAPRWFTLQGLPVERPSLPGIYVEVGADGPRKILLR